MIAFFCLLWSSLLLCWHRRTLQLPCLYLMIRVSSIAWWSQSAVFQVQSPTKSIVGSFLEVMTVDCFYRFVLDQLKYHIECKRSVHQGSDQPGGKWIHSAGSVGWTLTICSWSYESWRVCPELGNYTVFYRLFSKSLLGSCQFCSVCSGFFGWLNVFLGLTFWNWSLFHSSADWLVCLL